MLNNCIQYLSSHGFGSFAQLDVNKPDEGGVKFITLQEKVLELMEELGTFRAAMGSSFVTAQKNPPEEEKMPEQTPASSRCKFEQNITITGKALKYDETPIKRNPQTENGSPSQKDTPYTNRSIIVPHAIINSGSASQFSDMEAFLTAKFRGH